jgi:ABC-2 type transport system permease protein
MSDRAGTAELVRLIVRRDRVRFALWIAGIGLLVLVTVASTKSLYPTPESLRGIAAVTADNPAASALNGPPIALDTLGGQVAYQLGAAALTAVGLMCLLLTSRLTRGEEDSGRLELVRAAPVGRDAPLAAAVLVVTALAVVVGAATTAILVAEGLPTAGSVALGLSLTVLGCFFVGLTALTAQVTENPRVASGLSGAVLAMAYALRAAGDASGGGLSWASPIGWAQKARPYGGEEWWPLGLCLLVAVGLGAVSVGLFHRRDYGGGLIPPRRGPAQAARTLRNPIGLAVRLQRGVVLWWAAGLLLMAGASGFLVSSIEDFVSDNQAVEDLILKSGGATLSDSFLGTILLYCALGAAGAAVQISLRLRTEETAARAEAILATPVSRWRWVGSHTSVALVGSALGLVAAGLGLGATAAMALDDAGTLPRTVAASLVYLPAVWLLVGIALALFGLSPRWVGLAWGVWAFWMVVATFGSLLDPPGLVLDLSPFEHTALAPAEAVAVVPLAAILAVAAVLAGVGFLGARRRDIG